jgi:hypothetical protein
MPQRLHAVMPQEMQQQLQALKHDPANIKLLEERPLRQAGAAQLYKATDSKGRSMLVMMANEALPQAAAKLLLSQELCVMCLVSQGARGICR